MGVAQGSQREALGRSRGGLSTKIHLLSNELGEPVKFELTDGEVSDFTRAIPLLNEQNPLYVLADKGYDSDEIVQFIRGIDAIPVIPSKSNRKIQRPYNQTVYKQRNLIERAFNKLKQCRRIATRYDRKALYFLSFLHLAAFHLWQ